MDTIAVLLASTTAFCSGPAVAAPGHETWHWPLTPPPAVLRGFEPPALPWGPGHRGVDLAAGPGQPVYAAGTGRVSYAAHIAGTGVLVITHDVAAGLRTTYLPVTPSVRVGSLVAAGTEIGVVETAPGHCAPRLCLHWGLLRGTVYLDPLSLVCRPKMRLLPVWGVPAALAPFGAKPTSSTRVLASTRTPADLGRTGSTRTAPVQDHDQDHPMRPTGAGEASGGAVAGMLLTLTLSLIWGRLRNRRPRRPLPPGVVDLAGERKRRRGRPTRSGDHPA